MPADEQNVLITFESSIGRNKEDIISFFALFDDKCFFTHFVKFDIVLGGTAILFICGSNTVIASCTFIP